MEKRTELIILKITLGFLIVMLLLGSAFFVTALATKKNPVDFLFSEEEAAPSLDAGELRTSGQASTTEGTEAEVDDEEAFDEDDLSKEELANLEIEISS